MACMYKVGDAVTVRKNIKDCTLYAMLSGMSKGHQMTSGTMIGFHKGEILHISSIAADETYYRVEEDPPAYFTDEMFENTKPFSCRNLL